MVGEVLEEKVETASCWSSESAVSEALGKIFVEQTPVPFTHPRGIQGMLQGFQGAVRGRGGRAEPALSRGEGSAGGSLRAACLW